MLHFAHALHSHCVTRDRCQDGLWLLRPGIHMPGLILEVEPRRARQAAVAPHVGGTTRTRQSNILGRPTITLLLRRPKMGFHTSRGTGHSHMPQVEDCGGSTSGSDRIPTSGSVNVKKGKATSSHEQLTRDFPQHPTSQCGDGLMMQSFFHIFQVWMHHFLCDSRQSKRQSLQQHAKKSQAQSIYIINCTLLRSW